MIPRQRGEPAPTGRKPRDRRYHDYDDLDQWYQSPAAWPQVDEVEELNFGNRVATFLQIVKGEGRYFGLGDQYQAPPDIVRTSHRRRRACMQSLPVEPRYSPLERVNEAFARVCPFALADFTIDRKSIAVSDTGRMFRGMATTPAIDRQNHSVDPFGATFRNPLPLLWQHEADTPIGTVILYPATVDGIAFEATLPMIDTPGPLKDAVDKAWQSVKAGLVRSVSIGFRVLADGIERLATGTLSLKKTEIVELSLATIPSNPGAEIRFVKTLAGVTAVTLPGDSGAKRSRDPAMTINEQITAAENNRAVKTAAMLQLMQTAADTGTTLDAEQTKSYDELSAEVQSLDGTVKRWRELEQLNVASATPVPAGPRGVVSSFPVVQVKSQLPKGSIFTRAAISLLRADGDKMLAREYAKEWRDSPEVELFVKAATAPGTTTDAAWAGPLATMTNATNEFLELLRPATVLGKIPGLRQVPFNTTVPVQSAGGLYQWVGQAKAKPVGKLAFTSASLGIAKAAGIIVLTEELVRVSSPSAEAIVRNDMIKGIAQFLDQQFIDPAIAAVANVSPASITNGAPTIVSSNNALKDIVALMSMLTTANVPIGGVTLIMSETNGFALGMVRDPQGNRMFPGVNSQGGSIDGINVVTAQLLVIALQPDLILYADDGGATIDVSREASVQMDTAPMSPADATVVMTSLWQNNLVGLRVERFINWNRAIPASVAYATAAVYAPTAADAEAADTGGARRK
jgi:HK97 family phage major capsid protein/HK97 family phage prohead protease